MADWGAARRDAEVVGAAARRVARENRGLGAWLAAQSLGMYYAWMAQATSGGEGTAMLHEVQGDLDELRVLSAAPICP